MVSAVLTGGSGDIVHVGGEARHVVSYMKDFLFTPAQARTPVKVLSGGERARLLLAKVLAMPSNLLVLDEPTNDLDLETLDLLEEMIANYPGTVIAVSHDRDFLDRVATSVLMAEGEGRFVEYAGGYSDMLAQRGYGVEAKEAPKTKTPKLSEPKIRANSNAPVRKLSFKDKHALDMLPAKIAKLEKDIGALQTEMSDATLYARDPKKFDSISKKMKAAQEELEASEQQWLKLEMLREEIET
jgi:ATP-binding cassette subfamily F protein uup